MVESVNIWAIVASALLFVVIIQSERVAKWKRRHEELARVIKREADDTGEVWLCDLAARHGHPSKWDAPEEER